MLDLQGAQDPRRPRDTADDFRRDLAAGRVTVQAIEACGYALFPEQAAAVVRAAINWVRML